MFCCFRYSEDSLPEVDQHYSNEPKSPTIDRGGEKGFQNFDTQKNELSSQSDNTECSTQNHNKENSNSISEGHCANMKETAGIDTEDLHYVDDYYTKDGNGDKQVLSSGHKGVGQHKRVSDVSDKMKIHRQMSDSTGGKVKVHNHIADIINGKIALRRKLSDTEGGRVMVPGYAREATESVPGKGVQSSGSQHRVVLSDSTDMMLGLVHYEAVQVGYRYIS